VFIKAHELKATFRPTKKIYIDRYMRGAIREVVCTPYFDIWQRADGDFCLDAGPTISNGSDNDRINVWHDRLHHAHPQNAKLHSAKR
jgi:hypothetical protein